VLDLASQSAVVLYSPTFLREVPSNVLREVPSAPGARG